MDIKLIRFGINVKGNMIYIKRLICLLLVLFTTINFIGCNIVSPKPNDDPIDIPDEEPIDDEEEQKMDEEKIIYYDSEIDYTETLSNILNPERGFYHALEAKLSKNNTNCLWDERYIEKYTNQFSLFHLRVGLEEFSTNAGGNDSLISPVALETLDKTLAIFRKKNTTVIMRFSYNVKGITDNNGRYLNAEPSMDIIEKHITQLGNVLKNYYDIIASVETGMLGPWGEQHSTIIGDSSIENSYTYYRLVEAWLKALPSGRSITVRRPLYFTYWTNHKYNLELTTINLSRFNILDYPQYLDLKRVGVFNDGYLGSSSDLGTYVDRDSELAWLNTQAKYTLFGGEVVADSKTGGIGKYNSVNYLEKEALLTHTSYLNYYWNYTKVISAWEKNQYHGENDYYSNQTSEYTYVANHLGYRFVLRKSELANDLRSNKIYLKGKIENVGFGNVVNQKIVEVIVQNENKSLYFQVAFDVNNILSKETVDYLFEIELPQDLNAGEYDVLLKISDIHELKRTNLRSIQFANSDEYWNKDLGANFLGKIYIN